MDTSDIIQQLKTIDNKSQKRNRRKEFYESLFPKEVVEISVKDNKVILELSDGEAIESNTFKTSLTNDEVVSIVRENIDKLDLEKPISIEEIKKMIPKSLTEDEVKDLVKKHAPKFELDSKEFVNVAKVINDSVDQKTKALEKKIKPEKNIQTIRQDLENLYKENGLDAKFIKNLPKLDESKQMVKNSSTKFITQLKDVDPSRLEKGEDGRYILGSGSGGSATWDSITGTLSDNTDLQSALDSKATQTDIDNSISALVDSSPEALDTLNELAAALGDDPNFATTVTNSLANKQPLDAQLTSIAGLVPGAEGRYLKSNGLGGYEIGVFNTDVSANSDVVANKAKVSFPEAPQDGKQYARIDGTWVEVSGGSSSGGGGEKLQRLAVGGSLAFRPNTIVKKGNNLYACEQGKIHRFTRFSQGGDYLPNNGATSGAFYTPSTNASTIFSLSETDNFIYAVILDSGRTVVRIDVTDLTETAIPYVGQAPININRRFVSANDPSVILCLEESSSSQSIIRTFSLVNNELVNQNSDFFVTTANGLIPFTGITVVGALLASNGFIYHSAGGNLIKYNTSNNTSINLTDYHLFNSRGRGLAEGTCFFEVDGYVYASGHAHDSEDYTGMTLTVIDKI